MSGFTYRLGPFSGGLNNEADTPDTIADNELFSCVDFDYNTDNTLVTRPPVGRDSGGFTGTYLNIIGFFIDPNTGNSYTMFEIAGSLYYRQGSTSYLDAVAPVLIQAGFGTVSAGIQYADKFYFVRPTSTGASWSLSGGFHNISTFPAGSSIALFKERLWISAGDSSRLYFSNIATGDTWTSSDFLDVNVGDGQKLIAVFAGPSSLYLFKTGSTFVLTYDSSVTRGYVQNISTTIGLFDTGCIASYEGIIFILYGKLVYRLDGYTFTRVNTKVDIAMGADLIGSYVRKYSISTVNDRIMVQYYDKLYVYYPITNTWTQWLSTSDAITATPFGKWYFVPNSIQKYGYKVFLVSVNNAAPADPLFAMLDTPYILGTSPIDLGATYPSITTRMYSFDFYRRAVYDTPEHWKRLYWWGIDAIVSSYDNNANIMMTILPYTFTSYITWDLMSTDTWQIIGENDWEHLLDEPFSISTTVNVTDIARKYIKAYGNVRFTRTQFRIEFPDYKYTAVSSINHIIVNFGSKQNPVAASEGTQI